MVKKVLSAIMALTSIVAFSQQVVKGEVHDASGKVLSNVEVKVEGADITVMTDENGKFSLELPADSGVITFSAKNFQSLKKSVGKDTPMIHVTLAEGVKEISELVISAHKKLQVNKLNIKNLDAPMTVNVLNREALQKWDINNIGDASKLVAGVTSVKQYGGFQFFNIRGFDNFVVLYDGVRDERHTITQSAPVASFANVERVEFLKGPSGDMFGHSALGGIINIIRKKPTYTTKGDAKFTVGSYNTYNATVGIGGPIAGGLRYRVDAGLMNTDGFKNIREKTLNTSVMLQYSSPDHRNLVEVFAQYNNDLYGPDTGVPATNDGKPLSWIDPKINLADPRDYLKNDKKEFYLRFSHKFDFGGRFDYKLSYYDDSINYLMNEVLFVDEVNGTLSRRNAPFHFNHVTRPLTSQIDFNFDYKLGDVKIKTLVGNTLAHLDRKTYYGDIREGLSFVDVPIQNPTLHFGERIVDITKVLTTKEFVTSFQLQKWAEITDWFKVLGGVRYDHFSGSYDSKRPINVPGRPRKGSFSNVTYRGGISIQPIKNFLTIYGSASSFFKPSRSHDHRTGKLFKPEEGSQIEAGIKIEATNKVNVTLSGFYIEKKNLIVGHYVRTQVGKAYSRGFEIDADAEIVKGLYAKVGYAFTDAFLGQQKKEPGVRDITHNVTPWTPKHSLNAWVNYEPQFAKGFGLGLGVTHMGKTYREQNNDQVLQAYTLLNGMVYYQTKNHIRIGLNVDNILNALYFKNALSSGDLYSDPPYDKYQANYQISPGKDRNYKLTISYSF